MVIKTELCQYTKCRIRTQISRAHSPEVKAADCRSAGPWFNSGWRTLSTFMTWYNKLTNHDFLMINIMSPVTTSNRTIARKSVNMVAELALWISDTTERQEDYSAVAKATTATTVAIDTKARAAQGTVVQLKSELAQSQLSTTETKVLHAIALKSTSEFGSYAVVDWIQWPGVPILAGGPATDRMPGPVDHRHHRLEDDGGCSRGRYSSN